MTRKQGLKAGIRQFLESNVGQVVTSDQIRAAGNNASEWGRRLRELRDEEGYAILSHNDRADLKPGEYILESLKRRPAFAREISKETRALVLERNGYTCQMCGAAAGDPDPYHPSRTIRLTMGHVIDKSKGGDDTPSNLRALCSNCNEGLQNIAPPKPDQIHLLAQLRKAPREDQLAVLEWLRTKFKDVK
ncbi:MAG: HNH endonuclease [Anaerolineae bacterium]|nr:HNH endonuclease [Anaerolineae bacterium]